MNENNKQCCVCLANDVPLLQICSHGPHFACLEDLQQFFQRAVKSEMNFPPSCCENIQIDIEDFIDFLDDDLIQQYYRKEEEYKVHPKLRVYCANPKCGEWIPGNDLDKIKPGHRARCDCGTVTCFECRKVAPDPTQHHDCPGASDEEYLAKAPDDSLGSKRCPKCSIVIELREACNHVRCGWCKFDFCFVCMEHTPCKNGCQQWLQPEADAEGYFLESGYHKNTGLNRAGLNRHGQPVTAQQLASPEYRQQAGLPEHQAPRTRDMREWFVEDQIVREQLEAEAGLEGDEGQEALRILREADHNWARFLAGQIMGQQEEMDQEEMDDRDNQDNDDNDDNNFPELREDGQFHDIEIPQGARFPVNNLDELMDFINATEEDEDPAQNMLENQVRGLPPHTPRLIREPHFRTGTFIPDDEDMTNDETQDLRPGIDNNTAARIPFRPGTGTQGIAQLRPAATQSRVPFADETDDSDIEIQEEIPDWTFPRDDVPPNTGNEEGPHDWEWTAWERARLRAVQQGGNETPANWNQHGHEAWESGPQEGWMPRRL